MIKKWWEIVQNDVGTVIQERLTPFLQSQNPENDKKMMKNCSKLPHHYTNDQTVKF